VRGFNIRSSETRILLLLLLAFGLYDFIYVIKYISQIPDAADPPFGDFFGLWTFGRFAVRFPVAEIYDPALLQDFQMGLVPHLGGSYPYPYPPIFLLVLVPLSLLAYVPAYLVWMSATFAFYLLVLSPTGYRKVAFWVCLLAPATLFCAAAGQNGFLSGALIIGSFRWLDRRPILAGILLGCLCYKPQFGLLIPVALIAAARWRVLLTAGLAAVGLAAASALAFGPRLWLAWWQAIPGNWSILERNRAFVGHIMPTVTANLGVLGIGDGWVRALQMVVTLSVVALVWVVFRRYRGRSEEMLGPPLGALLIGTFLATPYAFIYDMPMVTAAVVVVAAHKMRTRRAWQKGELASLTAALLLPILMYGDILGKFPASTVVLLALFAVIVRLALSELRPAETMQVELAG
jgi:alpha-1,2-mannosyltransferase